MAQTYTYNEKQFNATSTIQIRICQCAGTLIHAQFLLSELALLISKKHWGTIGMHLGNTI